MLRLRGKRGDNLDDRFGHSLLKEDPLKHPLIEMMKLMIFDEVAGLLGEFGDAVVMKECFVIVTHIKYNSSL